jgi:hypothetical protein
MDNHFYSTFIGEQKICLVLLPHDAYRVSDKLWAIGEGKLRKFFVVNKTIEQQARGQSPCQAVFWDNFVFENFAVGSMIREIVKHSFVVTQ